MNNFKDTNICMIEVPERVKREQDIENLFEEIMTKKLSYTGEGNKHTRSGSTEAQTRWMQRGPRQDTSFKMPKVKDKERILKATREKQLLTYKQALIRLSTNFSKETLQARRDWKEIFKVMKSRDLRPILLYQTKILCRIEL